MKVSDAKKLVCPFIYNNSQYEGGHIKCIATECMAWKHIDSTEERLKEGNYRTQEQTIQSMNVPEHYTYMGTSISRFSVAYVFNTNPEPQDCQGYCQRIGNE